MRKIYLITALICPFFVPYMTQAQANPALVQETINPTWDVHWHIMKSPGSFGQEIGRSSFPLNFSRDWGYGLVYGGHDNHIGFKAYLNLYVATSEEFYFEIGADDGVALYIDGKQVLDLWSLYHWYRGYKDGCWYKLSAGWHKLELWFFEWRGKASVEFKMSDLNKWRDQLIWKNLTDLEGKVGSLEEKQRSLQGEMGKLGSKTHTLEGEVADLRGEIGTLKGEVLALKDVAATLSKDVDALKALVVELTELGAKVKAFEERQDILSKEIEALKEEKVGNGSWEVHWYEMAEPGVFGKEIGTSSFPLNFSYDWSYGRVYKAWDHVGLKAHAKIYLPIDSFCHFKVSANNCFILYIDGKKALEHWGVGKALHPAEEYGEYLLSAGWHEFELYYYEWEGKAWLSFYCW